MPLTVVGQLQDPHIFGHDVGLGGPWTTAGADIDALPVQPQIRTETQARKLEKNQLIFAVANESVAPPLRPRQWLASHYSLGAAVTNENETVDKQRANASEEQHQQNENHKWGTQR